MLRMFWKKKKRREWTPNATECIDAICMIGFHWMRLNVRYGENVPTHVWDDLVNHDVRCNQKYSKILPCLSSVQSAVPLLLLLLLHFTIKLLPLFVIVIASKYIFSMSRTTSRRKERKKSTSLIFYLDIYYNEANVLHILILTEFYWFLLIGFGVFGLSRLYSLVSPFEKSYDFHPKFLHYLLSSSCGLFGTLKTGHCMKVFCKIWRNQNQTNKCRHS